jgi:hypothetical protein
MLVFHFRNIGSSYETVMEVYTYDTPPQSYRDLISVACDHGSLAGGSQVRPAVLRTRQYVVAVSGVGGAHGTVRLNYSLNTNQSPQAPVLLSSPQPLVVTNGANVILAPHFAGGSPLRFVWRKDGTLLENSNSSSLQMLNVTPTNSGNYFVAITNDVGGVETTLPLRVVVPTRCELTAGNGTPTLSFDTFIGQSYIIERTD